MHGFLRALWDGISFVPAECPRGMSGMPLGASDDSVTSHFSAHSQRSLPQWPADAARVSFMFIACLGFSSPDGMIQHFSFYKLFLSQGNAAPRGFIKITAEQNPQSSQPFNELFSPATWGQIYSQEEVERPDVSGGAAPMTL